MSAYICQKKHIVFLVEAAISPRILTRHDSAFRWYWHTAEGMQRAEIGTGDFDRAAEAANMLWRENIKSVSHRYPNESSATLPGPIGEDFDIVATDFRVFTSDIDPVQVFKSLHCYEYQSCEHGEGWRMSEAKAFCDALAGRTARSLVGYDKAEWGTPKTLAEKQADYRQRHRS